MKKLSIILLLLLSLKDNSNKNITVIPSNEPLKILPDQEGGRKVQHMEKEIYHYLENEGQ